MWINDVIIYIMVFFLCLGAADKCLGNRFGLGERFVAGFKAMGPLTLAMVGILSLAPVLAQFLIPVMTPVYSWIGADPASFANSLLALDMGGYALAKEMAFTRDAELFSWVFLGTMLGPTVVFTIPVALGIITKADQEYFAKGILLGLMTIPAGSFVGSILAGLDLAIVSVNLIPTVVLSALLGIGLWKRTTQMMVGFKWFGKLIEVIAICGLVAVIIETLTGFVVIPNMTPLSEGFQIVGSIAIVLAGAFPMVALITKVFQRHLKAAGRLLKIDYIAASGLLASLAHSIPMFGVFRQMEPRGKVINAAFAVSGAFVFGGHLGFVAGIEKEMVFAMIAGKLVSGISAVGLALIVTRKESAL